MDEHLAAPVAILNADITVSAHLPFSDFVE
jgi:hypothetical protein